ncbi:MAG TPA: hypothetical protein VM143_07205 [Acidimicrobiales bacterium]|nr:hypothetical protein [Acidimicrobiales bacterium]
MTAAPVRPRPERLREVDLTFISVLAIAWVAAAIATSFTLWLLVGVVGRVG